MGKVVKYCAACEESFAEKFAFCPNCGSAMEAFEMNPLKNAAQTETVAPSAADNVAPVAADSNVIAQTSPPASDAAFPKVEPATTNSTVFSNVGASKIFADNFNADDDDVELELFDTPKTPIFEDSAAHDSRLETAPEEPETLAAATTAAAVGANGNDARYKTENFQRQPSAVGAASADKGFHVTVIQEKNAKQRNLLLLGAMVLMLTAAVGGMVYSIFNHPLLIGAIGDDQLMALVPLIDEVPMQVEQEPKPKPDKDSGGGGGGGREEKTPTSQGRLAPQMPDPPLITPTKTIPQKDFELKMQATTVGNKQVKPTEEPYGDPNAKFGLSPSDGMGKGGGQGSGNGTGQGSGKGLGQGSGNGSGSGSGRGNGNGPGNGDGDYAKSNAPPPPPDRPVGVTEKIKIISKPKPGYTDQARTNQVQGTVRVRVTFLPSGQVGSVTPVSGLPYGLTEQAIAAAKQIRFEPAKKNGVAQTSVMLVEYSFSIY